MELSPKETKKIMVIKHGKEKIVILSELSHISKLKSLGVYNEKLKVNGKIKGGWMIPFSKLRKVIKLLDKKKINFELRGFKNIPAIACSDANFWIPRLFWMPSLGFLIEREDESDGKVIGTAKGINDGEMFQLSRIDERLAELLSFDYDSERLSKMLEKISLTQAEQAEQGEDEILVSQDVE